MNIFILCLFLIFLLVVLLMVMQLLLTSTKQLGDANMTSVEAGFDKMWHNNFLSTPFLFLAILFVLFDMELILIILFIFFMKSTMSMLPFMLLLSTLIITLMVEWLWSKLKWQA